MGPFNRYSVGAALAVIAIAAVVRPGALVVAGLAALALAAHFWFWDPERHEVFADDWVEIGSSAASLACLVAGVILLGLAAL